MAEAGLTMNAAETLAPSLEQIANMAEQAKVSAEQIKEITASLLSEMGEADPTKKDGEGMVQAVLGKILEMRVQEDLEMSGSRHSGHLPADYYRADRQQVSLSARLGDAMAAQMADRLGLSFEPTTGREFAAMSRADMARMVARDARAQVSGDADAMRFWMAVPIPLRTTTTRPRRA
ncbi:hypothetical protein [Phaeovulum vinaykumarii]|uniref:Uncharacterized protein n=1 Tax=Phaeovulum vinaykumarii TaxID=407234 RepID=A0A1N7JVA4_9RHOB|nr:hypothetical protein [Phaeovulum vinaykumarii]SIS53269.1 hypothetical protein SAMN05421795_101366 [Phaeovulum vinaykumarii]SOB91537.1 hypothetical protein SAMN05878426_101364 [Phaeovulum vinaykumarii]